jgi:two-component system NtrC family sensor kinase
MSRMLIRTGQDAGQIFRLDKEAITIGRSPNCDVVIADRSASRSHAQIVFRDNRHYARDMGSTHGTFINDVHNNQEMLLSDGDVIRIGVTELVYQGDTVEQPIMGIGQKPVAPLSAETIAFSIPVEKPSEAKGLSPEQLEKLSRVADSIQSVLDLDELLGALMDVLFEILHPDRGVILLRSDLAGPMETRIKRPVEGELQVSQTIIDHAVSERMSLLVSDTAEDQRFSEAHSILAQAILSAICAPLVCKDKVLGVLYIDTKAQLVRYQKEDLALLNIIAANAAIAIENAMLVKEKLEAERLAAIGVAVAGISHYAKNILMGMSGSAQLIDTGIEKNDFEMVQKVWPVQKRATAKISTLIKDMLSYSKEREPNMEEGNLNKVIEETFENQASRAEQMKVELILSTDESLPDSLFEFSAIHDTVLNIAGNAIEACQEIEGARVILKTETLPVEGMLCVSITDNGPGIPPDIQKKIFEPFFSTKGSQGTGLGLAVARKSAEEHGGKLLLESSPGNGAAFRLLLPMESAAQITSADDETGSASTNH